MFFKGFARTIASIPRDIMQTAESLCLDVRVNELNDTKLKYRYPSFYECLGALYGELNADGEMAWKRKYDSSKSLTILDWIAGLRLAKLEGWVPYAMSAAMMKPQSYIDWHYDTHLRSMVCRRLHIPVYTNREVKFYSKWFPSKWSCEYEMPRGFLYELNNRVPHAVNNPSSSIRYHLIIDFIEESMIEYMVKTKRMGDFMIGYYASENERCIALDYRGDAMTVGDPLNQTLKVGEPPLFKRTMTEVLGLNTRPVIQDTWKGNDESLKQRLVEFYQTNDMAT